MLTLCAVPLIYLVGPFAIWRLARWIERRVRQPRPPEPRQRGFEVILKPHDPPADRSE